MNTLLVRGLYAVATVARRSSAANPAPDDQNITRHTRRTIKRHLHTLIVLTLVSSCFCLNADTTFELTADKPDWYIEGSIDQEPTLFENSPNNQNGYNSAIVAMNDPFTLTVVASYDDSVPGSTTTLSISSDAGVSVTWTRVDNKTMQAVVRPGHETLINDRSMEFSGYVEYTGTNAHTFATFHGTIYVYQELNIGMSAPQRSMLDFHLSKAVGLNHYPVIDDVNGGRIKVEKCAPFRISPATLVTGPQDYDMFREDGTASASISAPLSSPVDADGYIGGFVTLAASGGDRHSMAQYYVKLPFAIPENVAGYVTLQSREDVLMEPRPLVEGEILRPGDVIEVVANGNETGDLTLRFCDGHQARVQSYWGMRIALGTSHGIDAEKSSIHFWLSNAAFDVTQHPREYGKVIVYKVISDGVANMVVPGAGAARFILRKGVGKGVEYILKETTGGSASPQSTPQSTVGLSSSGAIETPAPSAANSPIPMSTYIAATLLSDGNMRVESGDGMLEISDGTNTLRQLPAGASVLVNLDSEQPQISGLAANDNGLPESFIQWSASDYSVVSNRTPYLEIRYPYGEGAFRLNTMECRINGILATEYLAVHPTVAELRVPPALALHPGTNLLEAAVTCISGREETAVTHIVLDAGTPWPTPERPTARASTNGVWLTWRPISAPDPVGYNVYYANSETGAYTCLTTNPCQAAAWLDQTVSGIQATQRWYKVQAVFPAATGPLSSPIRARWASPTTNMPMFALETSASGIRITPTNSVANFWPCRAERAESASGPWTNVSNGVFFGPAGITDTTAIPGRDYWYRPLTLTSNASVAVGSPSGPIQRPDALASLPTGLTARRKNGQVTLQWDPADEPSLAGYRIYRDQGSGFTALNTHPATGTTFIDATATNGLNHWRIVPVSTNGTESFAGSENELAWWENTGPMGDFRMARRSAGVTESQGYIDIDIERENGSADSVFVMYETSTDTWNAAEANTDYTPIGGTLIFAPGETHKTLRVNIVDDGIPENTENFILHLTGASSGVLLDWTTASTLVYIFNGNTVAPPNVYTTNFTATVGENLYDAIPADNAADSFIADTPPIWLHLNASNGRMTGIPDTPGDFYIPVTISNYGASTTVTVRIRVSGVPKMNWQSQQVGSSRWLGAHYAENRYILCGENGALSTSANGTSWTARASGMTNALQAVTYYSGQWVAVGDSGTIITSPDTAAWTSRTSGTGLPILGVTGGNGQFVAVGYELTILSSANGTSWTTRQSGGHTPLSGIVFEGNRFVVAGGLAWSAPAGYVSTNAVTWTPIDPGGGVPGWGFDDIVYGNGLFVVVGADGRICSSTNTIDWTQETSGTTRDLHAIAYDNGMFVAVGDSGTILTSLDGHNWYSSNWSGGERLSAVAGHDGLFVIGGANGLVLTAQLRFDHDGDGMCDRNEAIAGTDPFNRKSLLRMMKSDRRTVDGYVVRWASTTGRTYSVMYTDDLLVPFHILQSNIPGQLNFTEVTDTTATNSARFYKVSVEP